MDKNNSYLIISIILGFLITLFYIHQFDIVFLGNFILISFIIYILFYFLGNKEVVNKEMFQNAENNEEIDFEEGKDYKEQKFYLYVLNNGNKEYLTKDHSTDKIILGNDTSNALLFDNQFSKDKKYYHVLNAPPHQSIRFFGEVDFYSAIDENTTPDTIYNQLLPNDGSNTIEGNNEKIGSFYIYPDNSELKEIYKEFLPSERLEEEVDYEEGTDYEEETHMFDEEEAIPHMQESEYMDEEIMKEETFTEQMEEQEEHIRQAQEMEELQEEMTHHMEEEEEMRDQIRKKTKDKGVLDKIMENINNIKTGINSGIGLGISPVNINLSCGGDGPSHGGGNGHVPQKPLSPKKCTSGNSSRIYNNADWIYNKPYWKNQDESYNYNDNEESQKLEPCSKDPNSGDYLLPCIQPEANKIPQTLNNLMNSKKPKQGEVCPLEVNMPWSNYKTGDDKENNNILEGYSF